MGVYSSTVNESSALQVDAIECQYDNFHEGALAIIAESEYNYGMIMRAVGEAELCAYEATGKHMVYTEAEAGGFLDKVKAFFMGIWQKIKGLFNRFIAMLDSFTKSDKDFIGKYKKQLYDVNHSLKDFKYKGYEFTPDAVSIASASKAMDTVESKVSNWSEAITSGDLSNTVASFKKINEDFSDFEEELRGKAISESGGLTASDFSKALFEKLRKGESEKQELENPNLDSIVTQLQGAEKARKEAKKNFTDLEKIINYNIKQVETAKGKLIKAMPKDSSSDIEGHKVSHSDAISIASTGVKVARAQLAILQTINGAVLTALKDESRQNKSLCVSLLHYKPKKEDADMGGSWQHNVNEGFLANVKLK